MKHSGLALLVACLLGACSISDVVYVDPGGDDVDAAPAIDAGPDLTPPETTITAAPDRWSNDPSPMIVFETNEPAETWCGFDGAPLEPCNSPVSFVVAHDSFNSFTVRAVDLAGNIEQTPAEIIWGVDLHGPSMGINRVPPFMDNSSTAQFEFFGGGDYLPQTFECSLDGSAFVACLRVHTFTGLAPGGHNLIARSRDHVGNLSDEEDHAWSINTSTPDALIDSGPTRWTTSSSATLAFHSPDATATFECSLDSAAFAPCTSPAELSSQPEGFHDFRVRAMVGGTPDPYPAKWEWQIDVTSPASYLTNPPPPNSRRKSAVIEHGSDENWVSFEYSIDGGAYAASDYWQLILPDVGEGLHTLSVRTIDFAENPGVPTVANWTVDTTLPDTVILSGPPSMTDVADASFDFAASETSSYLCKLDDATQAPCANPFEVTLTSGDHVLEVRAVDQAGNIDIFPAVHTWTVTR